MSFDIGLLSGVIIGIASTLGARFIYEWRMRPIMEIQNDEPQKGKEFVRHSIRVANNGLTVAKNCNVLLTIKKSGKEDIKDYIIDDSRRPAYVRTDNYRHVIDESLCWSFQTRDPTGKAINPAFLPISPKSRRFVELCRVPQGNSLEIEVPSEMGWDIRRVILSGNEEYEFELKIFAENIRYDPKKHSKRFKLAPNSGKKDIVVEPL